LTEVEEAFMARVKSLSKLVRPLPKGQITLPIEFRRRLKIDDKTILSLSLKGSKIEILPLRLADRGASLREYEADEITRFLKEDRLDRKTADKVRRLLGKRA
jgi:bifunctional DNA-binding transcriptional regulator/antitoxin component of YhaV-PrlF toxin-antitoxin module